MTTHDAIATGIAAELNAKLESITVNPAIHHGNIYRLHWRSWHRIRYKRSSILTIHKGMAYIGPGFHTRNEGIELANPNLIQLIKNKLNENSKRART